MVTEIPRLHVTNCNHQLCGLGFDKIFGKAPNYLKPNDKMSHTDFQVHIYLIPDATTPCYVTV